MSYSLQLAYGTNHITVAFANLLPATSTTAASGFRASDGSVSFALNIPNDQVNDTSLYFVLAGPSTSSWIVSSSNSRSTKADLRQSVGMGNNKMRDTLMFIIYADSTGKNVTLSPRLSYGNVEPSYTSNVTYTVAPGSGISNGTMTASVQCHNCRSWKGGSVDPTNTAASFLFASGPRESLDSNSVTANLQRHSSYGTFTMDLTQAVGAGQFPSVVTTNTPGTVQDTDQSDNDFLPALHGALMIIAFFGLMPIGLLILRVMNNVKWHALNQSLSAIVALIGLFVGIYLGTLYNRVCRLFSHRPSLLTSFTVAKLQLCPSSIRHSYCSCNGGPIPPWVYTPSNLQEDVGSYKTCTFSYLAWPSCYPRWCSKWIPVSLTGTILSKIK